MVRILEENGFRRKRFYCELLYPISGASIEVKKKKRFTLYIPIFVNYNEKAILCVNA
uniref:Uncharacterized protein n=1 Tax=Rhizophagus irregularis (strain DAOM 181602 / DAOM 197198 / MUCL 43194) TaxID=747089 RepID=U9UK20_RHIID